MSDVQIYTKAPCPFCVRAKGLLADIGVAYREIDVTTDPELEREMIERSGRRTVPQVFIDGESVGGFDDLVALEAAGELDRLLGLAQS